MDDVFIEKINDVINDLETKIMELEIEMKKLKTMKAYLCISIIKNDPSSDSDCDHSFDDFQINDFPISGDPSFDFPINGYVYKICSSKGNKVYIGSTRLDINKRFNMHKASYRFWKSKNQNYTSSFKLFEKYGVENCEIILLETCPISELHNREKYYIQESLSCVNINNK